MKNRALGCFGSAVTVALVLSLAVNAFLVRWKFGRGSEDEPRKLDAVFVQKSSTTAGKANRIAQIDITGVISSGTVPPIKAALHQAGEDARVKAIVLRLDTPGGEVTASDTLFQAVKKTDAIKPVIVYMDAMAASGGYYISCAARKVVAHPHCWTGSIGVIVRSLGYGKLFENHGLEMRIFKSGPRKDTFYGQRPLTPEDEAYVNHLVSQCYERFLTVVSDARKLDRETLRAGLADGRVISGTDALTARLVDQNGYIEDAYEMAKSLAGIADAEVVRLEQNRSLVDFLGLDLSVQGGKIPERIELDIAERLLPHLEPGRCYMLPTFLAQ